MGVLLVAFPEYALAVPESQCRVAASSCAPSRISCAGEAVGQFPRPCRPDQPRRACRVHISAPAPLSGAAGFRPRQGLKGRQLVHRGLPGDRQAGGRGSDRRPPRLLASCSVPRCPVAWRA